MKLFSAIVKAKYQIALPITKDSKKSLKLLLKTVKFTNPSI